jgi:alanine-glyoxylate transaminase/serine-glyoxylate transaminase/serine-pyruvate transaminase
LAGKDSQPFVVAGSGALAMDWRSRTRSEPGGGAVVVDAGYFSARMLEIITRWGGNPTRVAGPVGNTPSLDGSQRNWLVEGESS